jgi:hypothetical protein
MKRGAEIQELSNGTTYGLATRIATRQNFSETRDEYDK